MVHRSCQIETSTISEVNIYAGYVITRGKAPIETFKDRNNLKTLEEVENCPEYAGVLADDVILVDIDDHEQSEILFQIISHMDINCVVRQTTRGKHFLFQNSGVAQNATATRLACGLTADLKVGSRNSVQVLKLNGKRRPIMRDCDYLDPLPKWLHPVNCKVDFWQMREGDGRDSGLYGYILTLTNAGFSKEEIKECIDIINNYILDEPLSEKDIERITREDAFPNEAFFKDNKFLHHNFGDYMVNNGRIKWINGQLYIYDEGVYVAGQRLIENRMQEVIPFLKAAQRMEVFKYMEIMAPVALASTNSNLIAFANGLYDLEADELKPFTPDQVILNKIPWNFNGNAYSDLADKVLNDFACHDPQIRAVLEEAIGYCFFRQNEMSKSFFLVGDGANGKSTFLSWLKALIGDDNTATLALEELGERFASANLVNKLVNLGDDISDEFWTGRNLVVFKKLVSGNSIKGEHKGKDIFFFSPYCKFFFSANSLPRTESKGFEAVKRRLVIIPFNAKFSSTSSKPWLIKELCSQEPMEYLIQLGIAGLKRVLANNDFSQSDKINQELEEYTRENNPILLFLDGIDDSEIIGQPTQDVYLAYRVFCQRNGFGEMTLPRFSRELKKYKGLETKVIKANGKCVRIYCNCN